MSVHDEELRTKLSHKVLESGATKIGEDVANRGLNAVVDFVKKKYGESRVRLGTVFERYLENARQRYNQVRTLVTGQTPRKIVGSDSFYISIGLRYGKETIDTSTIDPMLDISNNILILGTGGAGKSMLMRYLFVKTADYGEYIPVLVELRRMNNQPSDKQSILELVYACMQGFDVELPREQFEYSLQLGKYLFLFDGLDEIKATLFAKTVEEIQDFCAKYPLNPCIITSRPKDGFTSLETFTIMRPLHLNKAQAVELSKRIGGDSDKVQAFCKQLEEVLFDKHKDFAENPLLLSMMYLTFMRNMSIPDHLSDFYQKAYDALYSLHDSQDKGNFKRDFKCKELDENSFKRLFSHFCFHTYMKEIYEFTYDDIIGWLRKSIDKLNLVNIEPNAYLDDLRDAVCMMVKDGDILRFSHRSFQTFFAAVYTSKYLTDEQQKRLFGTLLSENTYFDKKDYYSILAEIEKERFSINALEDNLRIICRDAKISISPLMFILNYECKAISINTSLEPNGAIDKKIWYTVSDSVYCFNTIHLFRVHIEQSYDFDEKDYQREIEYIENCLQKITEPVEMYSQQSEIRSSFADIDASDILTNEEKAALYKAIVKCNRTQEVYDEMVSWLNRLDTKREQLKTPDFISDL